jgi:hypothetical protein
MLSIRCRDGRFLRSNIRSRTRAHRTPRSKPGVEYPGQAPEIGPVEACETVVDGGH